MVDVDSSDKCTCGWSLGGEQQPKLKFAVVIPTRNRPQSLRTLLTSLRNQSVYIETIVIVDSSDLPDHSVTEEYPELPICHVMYGRKPSAAAQRNLGVKLLPPTADLVCFIDDDEVLLANAMGNMSAFWMRAGARTAGAGFSLVARARQRLRWLKRSRLAEALGLYTRRSGWVAPSGWQAMVGHLKADTQVQWLSTAAVVWRRWVLDQQTYEEYFDGYSYLEDLDFSYAVSRGHELYIVAGARVEHQPDPGGRPGHARFGCMEVRNRIYFVWKHGLSPLACALGLAIRFVGSLLGGALCPARGGGMRALGNLLSALHVVATGGRELRAQISAARQLKSSLVAAPRGAAVKPFGPAVET